MTGDDAAQQLEHEADQLEHHLDELQDHIDEASKTAAARREDVALTDESGDADDAAPEPLGSIDPTTTTANETAEAQPADDGSAPSDDDEPSSDDDAVGGPTPGHASGGDD